MKVILIGNTMSKSNKNATKMRISITILPSINEMLEQVCQKIGKSKSVIVESAVTEYLSKRLHMDLQQLSEMKFDDLPTEDEWLSLQNETR